MLPHVIDSNKLGEIALLVSNCPFLAGNLSKMYRGMCQQGDVAVKVISPHELEPQHRRFIMSEVSTMRTLQPHRNIVELLDVIDRDDGRLYVVMRLAHGGDLLGYVNRFGPFSEQHAAAIFVQLLDAVQYCHGKGIVHRDLKLENVLIDDVICVRPSVNTLAPRVMLADFGFACTYSPLMPLLNDSVGSPQYAAGELYLGHRYYGPEVDCFALGVILYALVHQRLPFRGTPQQVRYAILSGRYLEEQKKTSVALKSLLRRILSPISKDRPSLDGVRRSVWMQQQRTDPSSAVVAGGQNCVSTTSTLA